MTTNNLFSGIKYLIDGFSLITTPGIKRFVIIPLMINIVLFTGLLLLSQHFFGEFNQWILHHLPSWLQWISSILWIVFFIGFFLVMIYTFVTFANLIAAPFNSLLAEKVDEHLSGKILPTQSFLTTVKDIPRIIGRQLAILGYYFPRAILLLILFFIPVVQIIAAALWFFFNAWYMTLQYVDYPTDNRRISIDTVRARLADKRWLSLGFGICVLLFTMIPIINFFVIPAAVAGATKLWIKEFK